MCGKNENKTAKLLEGLEGQGISLSVRNLAGYMAGIGIRVTPHVGRMRCNIVMPSFGIDEQKMSENGSAFYQERVSNGRLNFIPNKKELELAKIERRLRIACERRTLASDFMPVDAYKDLRCEFQDLRKQYFLLRDEIIMDWPQIYAAFEQGATEMLDGVDIPADVKNKVLEKFLDSVPSKEKYAASFAMDLRVHAFHADLQIPGLETSIAEDVRKTWSNEVVSTAIVAIERQIGEGWERTMKAMRRYLKDGVIAENTLASLKKYSEELKWKNVFHNSLLEELLQNLQDMDREPNIARKADILEQGIANIWGYAKENGLQLKTDGIPYSIVQLDELLQFQKKAKITA